jgi:hypothetical protein
MQARGAAFSDYRILLAKAVDILLKSVKMDKSYSVIIQRR